MQENWNKSRDIKIVCSTEEAINLLRLQQARKSRSLYVSSLPTQVKSIETADLANENIQQCNYQHVYEFLGQEFNNLIYDATFSFDANSFCAVCGTLVGGGTLYLVITKELLNHTNSPSSTVAVKQNSALLTRLVSFNNLNYHQTNHTDDNLSLEIQNELKQSFSILNSSLSINSGDLFKEQKSIVEKIKRCALGHSRRPVVIQANRGRGKSAALGIAVAELIFEGFESVVITCSKQNQSSIIFKHIRLRLTALLESTQRVENLLLDSVKFLALDQVQSQANKGCLLIVEEAGTVPVQILKTFCKNFNRITLATTIDGYEGNGQGFAIRFMEFLSARFPQMKLCNLNRPIRWVEHDQLEKLINQSFILDSRINLDTSAKTLMVLSKPNLSDVTYQYIPKETLNTDDYLLREIYGLLVSAHYQTRPSDLERILSSPETRLFIASYQNSVIATALVNIEGKLLPEQIDAIAQNKLRLKGDLLPQSLIAYKGDSTAGIHSYWRVMRVTVNPRFQRNGIGLKLLAHIESEAKNNHIDILGASFALAPNVVKFWYRAGFNAIRIALTKDSSSGYHAGDFLRLINHSNKGAQTTVLNATEYFNDAFKYSTGNSFKKVPVSTMIIIFELQIGIHQPRVSKDVLDRFLTEAKQLVLRNRSYEMVEWSLFNLCFSYLADTKYTAEKLSVNEKEILFAKLIQQKDWLTIIDEFEFVGIKQSRESTRLAIAKLLAL
ncbi:MAG: GNAT family N-acetyltransferase [Kangiellaceae bacterium]|nr:GNAT family N-acetyltransferase [Kangiellaceae bacterium]